MTDLAAAILTVVLCGVGGGLIVGGIYGLGLGVVESEWDMTGVGLGLLILGTALDGVYLLWVA